MCSNEMGNPSKQYTIIHEHLFNYVTGPENGFLEEKVYEIKNDDLETAKVALVANGERKRWIIATEGIEVGHVSS